MIALHTSGVWLTLVAVLSSGGGVEQEPPPSCDSDIFCHGQLLHTVQTASIFPDSKTFVDMKMKYGRNETIRKFELLMSQTKMNPSQKEVREFVENTFEEAGSEFEEWDPSDWVESPAFLSKIKDGAFRDWAADLNHLWKMLGRKMKDAVRQTPTLYSIIYVPNPVIVPGGRFREFYYWDSYWIVKGLLLSEMHQTVKGMLGNFISIVDQYGFIPNGGRIYYLRRSQPPLLIPMVKLYLDATGDYQFLTDNIGILEREYEFWLKNRTITVEKDGKNYMLAAYNESSTGPRPESYREDFMAAKAFPDEDSKQNFYSELKSAAESGWDFSSRWFVKNGTNKGKLTDLKIKQLIPVELNAILCWNARLLAEFYEKLNMTEKANTFWRQEKNWIEAVTKVLWNDKAGIWLDWDTNRKEGRDFFAASNLFPLWAQCYDRTKTERIISRVMKYLEQHEVMDKPGGVPTTLEMSGEQWDFPNAWPPLQHAIVVGLDSTDDLWAKRLAFETAEKWVRSNYKAYNETQAMYEKYDASKFGGHGGGGEYAVQLGFGWSNGVIMDFLAMYGDRLTLVDQFMQKRDAATSGAALVRVHPATTAQVLSIIFGFLATLSAGCIGLIVYNRKSALASTKSGAYPKLKYSKLQKSERRSVP